MHPTRRRFPVAASRSFLIAAVVAVCLLATADAFGCPNCKDAVNTADPEGLNVARGYFYSILIMLAMPFTLISSFGVYVWREMQRQKRSAHAAAFPASASEQTDAVHPQTAALP